MTIKTDRPKTNGNGHVHKHGWDHNKLWAFHPAVTTGGERSHGQRAADLMKRTLATWSALICMAVFIGIWMLMNSWIFKATWDPYPWILLNLCLSTLAGLQCFVLLIANKRGEQIQAELTQHTFDNTVKQQTLIEQNTALTEQIHALTHDVHKLTQDMHRHIGCEDTITSVADEPSAQE